MRMVEKPWGQTVLPQPFFAPAGQRIGEVWFEPPAALDSLLVKYIFTAENLSVQLHPSDEQTQAAGLGRNGKEECWLVIDAKPDARLAVGFAGAVDQEAIRAAALDGSIEKLLVWHKVQAGDFFYLPANTVHAIGAGISLIEVQQNSDITYRLYDYGRPRTLHLDEGLKLADGRPHDPALRRHVPPHGHIQLVDGPHFRLDRLNGPPDAAISARYKGALLAIPLAGVILIDGTKVQPGECGQATTIADIGFTPDGLCLIAQPV